MGSKSQVVIGPEDRISRLPGHVLVHILSFLPTLFSVRTTVLSKTWKDLWTSVPILDFDQREENADSMYMYEILWRDFVGFSSLVGRALSLHNLPTITKFRLYCGRLYDEDLSCFHDWIYRAVSGKIREIDLGINHDHTDECPRPGLELPQRFFFCNTLEVLKVRTNCIICPPLTKSEPGYCYFPSLKFADVYYDGPWASMLQLLSNCPVLQNLSIHGTIMADDADDADHEINFPELKTLSTGFFGILQGSYIICFNVPKLENLEVWCANSFVNYIFNQAKSLIRAQIDIECDRREDPCGEFYESFYERASSLLAGVSAVKYLALKAPDLEGCSLPDFTRLKQLKLTLFYCSCRPELLMDFLLRSPNLEDLVFNINVRPWYDEPVKFEPFKPPETVPLCVLSHLQTISINSFMGFDDEFDVMKYFLKHGQVLKKITISTSDAYLWETRRMTQDKLKKKICKYQKFSKTCEIEIEFRTVD